MKVRDVVRLLRSGGWYLARTRGAHHQYKHPTKPGLVTVPGNMGDEVQRNMHEAIQLHLEGLKDAACEVPEPHTWSAYVEVSA